MPTHEQHIAQATHNETMLTHFMGVGKQTEFSDWYVTVGFYTALHYFEAMLDAVNPIVPIKSLSSRIRGTEDRLRFLPGSSPHYLRNDTMKRVYPRMYSSYFSLYEMSRSARYKCHEAHKHDWQQSDMLLDDVKRECLALIAQKKK